MLSQQLERIKSMTSQRLYTKLLPADSNRSQYPLIPRKTKSG